MIQMVVDHCKCCRLPVEQCPDYHIMRFIGLKQLTYEVIVPPDEVTEDALTRIG